MSLSCRSRVNSLHSTRYNMDKSHKLQHCKICVSCRISCGRVAARHLWQGCDSPHCASKVIAQSPHGCNGTAEVCPSAGKVEVSMQSTAHGCSIINASCLSSSRIGRSRQPEARTILHSGRALSAAKKAHKVDMGPASARSAATATYVARCCQQQQRAGLMNIRVSYNTYTTETTITCRVATRQLWQGCDSPLVAGLRLANCGRVATRHLWQGCDSPYCHIWNLTRKQTNLQTCKQPTNPSNELTDKLTVTRTRHKRLLRPWWRWCLMMRCWRRGRGGICGTCRRLVLATSMAALWSTRGQMARSSWVSWTMTSACGRYLHALAIFVSCRSYCGMVATRHLWQGCDSPHCHMSCGRVVTRNVAWLACCHIIDA